MQGLARNRAADLVERLDFKQGGRPARLVTAIRPRGASIARDMVLIGRVLTREVSEDMTCASTRF